jgi:hypothetical protein
LKSFKWHFNQSAIDGAGSLDMTESTFATDIFSIRRFHEKTRIEAPSH